MRSHGNKTILLLRPAAETTTAPRRTATATNNIVLSISIRKPSTLSVRANSKHHL